MSALLASVSLVLSGVAIACSIYGLHAVRTARTLRDNARQLQEDAKALLERVERENFEHRVRASRLQFGDRWVGETS